MANVSPMKLTNKWLRNQNTADISRKTERSERSVRIGGRSEEMVASSATSEPLSEVHSRFISLYPSRNFTGLCIILRAGVPVGIVWSPVEPLYPPWPPSRCIYYIQASRERRGWGRNSFFLSHSRLFSSFISRSSSSFTRIYSYRQKRIRQKREGSACWIAEPRGVGAHIKGAVRLEGAPNYDVTDRTRRDQVSRIQNGLLITESSSPLRSPRWPSLTSVYFSESLCAPAVIYVFLLKIWRHLND